ncbi:hypothetical protein MKW98_021325 [Papaver atlanticum]|uniref:Uncharacterized protein n=1 Tax=Papaver atlanticum TaxID=357466 RepID=A0AAD4SPT5_9MAGN|nr:hypothetical protein MKW98_021325 [Papaver atlanticum]
MRNNKSDESDIETPLLGGATATIDNDDSLKNPCFNWLFESVFRNMKTLILSAQGGQSEEFLESLPKNVRKRVEVLQTIQGQHDKLKAKFFEERAALEAKYQKLYAPLYNNRFDIFNGVVEVGVSGEAIVDKNGDTYIDIAIEEKKDEKGVPNFWLTAMNTNAVLADEIQERDEGAPKYLKDIKWCRVKNLKGFKLEFFFDPNPYFKNTVLTKIYDMVDEDEPILDKVIGTEIEWLPGKNLTQKVLKKVPRKGYKNTKPITKNVKCESFFNFFNPPQVPDNFSYGSFFNFYDDETDEDLEDQMEHDYDLGTTIRDTIIPHAVLWFTEEVEYI